MPRPGRQGRPGEGIAQTESLLVGTWIQCEGEPLPWPPGDYVGIQFDADGTYYLVYEVGGSLVRTEGLLEQGTWRVIDTTEANGPGFYQLNLTTLGGGTATGRVVVLQQPIHFRFGGYSTADYQLWNGPAPVPGDAPSAPTRRHRARMRYRAPPDRTESAGPYPALRSTPN